MTKKSAHPSVETLNAYSLGRLPTEQAAAIDDHISECHPCCETIFGFADDDTFMGELKAAVRTQNGEPVVPSGTNAIPSSLI